ncbi:MAG: peroxiredoxin [Lutibacter sp.]|nr:MAG: peroxiredoxin [Lutibacter sp.]
MIDLEDKIPLFTLKDQEDNDFSIENLIGKKSLVIFFYPKDFTPGCVREVCAFRDQYQDFLDCGVEVIGISSDGLNSHKKFAEKHNLPFTLLSDVKGKIRKLFGVPSSFLGLLPGRMTFVIDKQGIVKMRFNNQFGAEKHISASLKVLKATKN